MFGRLFSQNKRSKWAVDRLHQSILNQALRPEFYFDGGARDNFSGRFEMTSLHAAMVFRRLRTMGGAGRELAQETFDELFQGFDEALRDIGTGDLTVGKKIRKMGEAFYGRAKAYDEALGQPGDEAVTKALGRNLGLAPPVDARFARYARSIEETLQRHAPEAMLSGEINWPRLGPAQAAAS